MNISIKDKLEKLFSKETIIKDKKIDYSYLRFKKSLLLLVFASLSFLSPKFMGLTYNQFFKYKFLQEQTIISDALLIVINLLFTFSLIYFIFLTLFIILEFINEQEFLFVSIYKNEKIRIELKKEFGSIERVVSIYKELDYSKEALSDENFYKLNLKNEEIIKIKKNNKRDELIDSKIERFQSKIEQLQSKIDELKEKRKIASTQHKRKIGKMLNSPKEDLNIAFNLEKITA